MVWGEIPESQWELKTYDKDPDAQAVILCDYGERDLSQALSKHVLLHRHRRVKILTEGGKDWADQTLPFYAKAEKIKDIQAQTLNWVDGKVEKHILEESDFSWENLEDDVGQIKFFLPQVKPGSIIEIKYTLVEENVYRIRPWHFQSRIPTLHSELRFSNVSNGTYVYTNIVSGLQHKQVEFLDKNRWVLKDSPTMGRIAIYYESGGACHAHPFSTEKCSRIQYEIRL